MKVCPFCREEIRDEAIKCRYCSSSLVPRGPDVQGAATTPTTNAQFIYVPDKNVIQFVKVISLTLAVFALIGLLLFGYEIRQAGQLAAHAGPSTASVGPTSTANQTVYIVDQGLVRFAKFTGGILAVFVTVGLFFYGLDIKQLAKEVRAEADRTRQIREDAAKLLQDAKESNLSLKQLANDTQIAQEKIRERLAEIEAQARSQISLSVQSVEKARDVALVRITGPDEPQKKEKLQLHPRGSASFTVPELARLYDFPDESDGNGQCIGLIELNGGYAKSDLDAYFDELGLRVPTIAPVSIDGVKNVSPEAPGTIDAATINIEIAGAVAPGARLAVYLAPNTSQGFFNAISAAVADTVNKPSVIVVTWGAPESTWSKAAMKSADEIFKRAAVTGITIVAAGGDNGVTSGVADGRAHVFFPASSPWLLACGGTRIITSAKKLKSEVVWNDGDAGATGGGVSNFYPGPDWQSDLDIPVNETGQRGRGIPDVAANASPQSGYEVFIRKHKLIIGGTSASTALWAGLIALMNQALGRNVGYIHPLLYSKIGPAGVLRTVTEGDNSVKGVKGYSAGPGWNACTGWGSPNGWKLLEALQRPL